MVASATSALTSEAPPPSSAAQELPAPRFRGKSYLAMVLQPAAPLDLWLQSLAELGRRSPGFFTTRPIVLDISDVALDERELMSLVSGLEKIGIRVMGFEGARDAILAPGLPPVLSGGRQSADICVPRKAKTKANGTASSAPKAASLLVENVRSGQSVIFAEGDVTVTGSVASGAEVVAGGSIHIYGALRGRAIAGAQGNAKARIFCRKLEAEFLAIDASYLTAESIDASYSGQPVQIRSEHETLKLDVLR